MTAVPSVEREIADLQDAVRGLSYSRSPHQLRRSATVAGATSWSAATAYGAPPDGLGPDVTAYVGPSGRLAVSVGARLAITSGTTPRLLMGWQATGPYLDEARTATPDGVAAAVAVAAADARSLSLGNVGEVGASRLFEVTGLATGWYLVQSRYALTGSGVLAAAASLRELITLPV